MSMRQDAIPGSQKCHSLNIEKPFVYLYRRSNDNWYLASRIYSDQTISEDLRSNSTFGESLALSGSTLIVGERSDACPSNETSFSQSSIYVNGEPTNAYQNNQFHILTLQSTMQRDFQFEMGKSQTDTFFKGDLAELIVFKDNLSTFERKKMESELGTKYAILLPNDIYAGDSDDQGNYTKDISYIGKAVDELQSSGGSKGLTLVNGSFLQDHGDYMMFGHNLDTNTLTAQNLSQDVQLRWSRSWYVDMDDVNGNGGNISFQFNYAASGYPNTPIGVHALIYTPDNGGQFEILQTKLILAGNETIFDVNVQDISDGYYTLGLIFQNDEYVTDITGIGKDAETTGSMAESAGLTVENISFLQDNGDFMLFGHKTPVNQIVTGDLPQSIEARWSRSWFIDFTDQNDNGGEVKLTFNYNNGDLPGTPTGMHALIKRTDESSNFEVIATQLILSGTETQFTINVNDLGDGFYTLGLVKNFAAENSDHVLDFVGIYKIDPYFIPSNHSSGLKIENVSFLYDNWDYLVWGHQTPELTLANDDLPGNINYRWNRDYYINFSDTNDNGGDIVIQFDFISAGFGEPYDAEYFLIKRNTSTDIFSEVVGAVPEFTDRSVNFVMDVSNLDDAYYCIGMNLILEIEDLTGTPAGLPISSTANDLSLWLKPEKLEYQAGGNPISQWTDASDKAFHAIQSNRESQPAFIPDVINGHHALHFDGFNDYLNGPNETITARTVFAVLKVDTDASYLSCLLTEKDSDNNNIRTNVPVSVWRAPQHYADDNDFSYHGFGAVNGYETDHHDCQYHILTQISDSQKEFEYRISQIMHQRYFKGDLSELIVFSNALNKSRRRIIENYLSAKYNIPIAGDRYNGDSDALGNYDMEVSGIGKDYDGDSTQASSGGLLIDNISFLQDDGDYLLYGHQTQFNIISTKDLAPDSGITRWIREWYVEITDINENSGTIKLTFDYSKAGFYTLPPANVALLGRNDTQSEFEIIPNDVVIDKDRVLFIVQA